MIKLNSVLAAILLSLLTAARAYADMASRPQSSIGFNETPELSLTLAAVLFAGAIVTAGLWLRRRQAKKAPLVNGLLLSTSIVLLLSSFCQLNSGLPSHFFEKAIATTSAKKWPKAYTATFELRAEGGGDPEVFTYKQYSNGYGLVRCGAQDGSSDRVVYDFVRRQSMYTEAKTKTYRINREFAPPPFDQASALAANLEPRGTRNIDGHPCHGWLQVGSDRDRWTNTETWIGDDTQCEVESITKRIVTINMTVKLKAYSAESPDPALFQTPQGYTLKSD
jgi:hypothetical protein